VKKLIYIFISFTLFSCVLNIEEEEERLRFHETYFEFANEKATLYQIQFEQYRAEGRTKSFFKKYDATILDIDSTINATYEIMDSCINSSDFWEFDKALLVYNSTLSKMEIAFKEFENDYDEKPYKSNYELIKKDDKRIILTKLKVDLAISYSNYLQVLFYWIDGAGAWSVVDLQSESKVDSNGNVIIILSSEGLQLMPQGRQLVLEKVLRNGKAIIPKYNFIRDYTFTNLQIDSLDNADYLIKGKVRYYTIKGIRDYTFEELIKVQN